MSLNISVKLLRAAQSVTLHLDTARLSPKVLAMVKRMVKSGIVVGDGEAGTIARVILDSYNLPHLSIHGWSGMYMRNVPVDPEHPLRKFVQEQYAIVCMTVADEPTHWYLYARHKQRATDEMTGWIPVDQASAKTVAKGVSMNYAVVVDGVMDLTLFDEEDPMP